MVLVSGSTNAKSRAFTVRLFLSNLRLQQFETDGDRPRQFGGAVALKDFCVNCLPSKSTERDREIAHILTRYSSPRTRDGCPFSFQPDSPGPLSAPPCRSDAAPCNHFCDCARCTHRLSRYRRSLMLFPIFR